MLCLQKLFINGFRIGFFHPETFPSTLFYTSFGDLVKLITCE